MDEKHVTTQQGAGATGEAAAKRVILNSTSPRIIRRNFQPPGFWLYSPAIMLLFRTLLWALEDLAVERRTNLGSLSQVTRVRLARTVGDSRIYLYPTDWDDPNGLELLHNGRRMSINCYKFLADAGALVDTGYAERFSIEPTGTDSPVGRALVFDKSLPLERKIVKKPAKKAAPPAYPAAPLGPGT